MKFQDLKLLPGDRIVVPKSRWNFIQHHAIYLGTNVQGDHVFAENKSGIGVRLVTDAEFFEGVTRITAIERFKGSKQERELAVERALSCLGIAYELIDYNCEHFANEVQYQKRESKQVTNVLAGLFLGLIAGAILSD